MKKKTPSDNQPFRKHFYHLSRHNWYIFGHRLDERHENARPTKIIRIYELAARK